MIKPLPGYVLIEPIEEEKKEGAIYLPESSKDKPSKGKVIVCGEDIQHYNGDFGMTTGYTEACPTKEGQTVLYKKWVNQEVKYEGKEYLLVKFDELLAVIE